MEKEYADGDVRSDSLKDSTQGSWTLHLIVAIMLVISASFSFGYGISGYSTKPPSNGTEMSSNDMLSSMNTSLMSPTALQNHTSVVGMFEATNMSVTDESLKEVNDKEGDHAVVKDGAMTNGMSQPSHASEDTTVLMEDGAMTNGTGQLSLGSENMTGMMEGMTKDDVLGQIAVALPQTMFFIGNMVAPMTMGLWYKLSFVNRKSVFLINHGVLIASVFFALIAIPAPSAMYISRFLHGYQGGMACAIVPTYLAEVSPKKIRGQVGFLHQLAITIGIFAAQLFGLPGLFRSLGNRWTLTYLVGAVPSMLSLFLYKKLPMSPVELVSRYKSKAEAENVLRKLRKENDVSADMRLIEQDCQAKRSTSDQMGVVEVIKSPGDRWQLLLAITLLSVQALSGINVVFAYADVLFNQISEAHAPYLTLVTGIVNVVVTIAGVGIIEKVGRRHLTIRSNIVIIISHVILTIIFVVAGTAPGTQYTAAQLSFAMIFILTFIAAFAIALGPIPFLYSSEITRSESRNAILNIALGFNYLINIFIPIIFIAIRQAAGGYVYLIFAVPVFLGTVLFHFKMVETKNKSVEEIEAFFNAGRENASSKLNHF